MNSNEYKSMVIKSVNTYLKVTLHAYIFVVFLFFIFKSVQ